MSEKIVVVTGASSGIGEAVAQLAAGQHQVVLVARRQATLDVVAARCQGRGHVNVADVSKRTDVTRVVEESIARFGRVDVWINNVGQGITRAPSELTDGDIDEIMQVNVKSALYGMQEVLPHFKTRGEGHVINVSSMLGRIPNAMSRSAYCGAKHFLNALTATFREEIQQTYPAYRSRSFRPGSSTRTSG